MMQNIQIYKGDVRCYMRFRDPAYSEFYLPAFDRSDVLHKQALLVEVAPRIFINTDIRYSKVNWAFFQYQIKNNHYLQLGHKLLTTYPVSKRCGSLYVDERTLKPWAVLSFSDNQSIVEGIQNFQLCRNRLTLTYPKQRRSFTNED